MRLGRRRANGKTVPIAYRSRRFRKWHSLNPFHLLAFLNHYFTSVNAGSSGAWRIIRHHNGGRFEQASGVDCNLQDPTLTYGMNELTSFSVLLALCENLVDVVRPERLLNDDGSLVLLPSAPISPSKRAHKLPLRNMDIPDQTAPWYAPIVSACVSCRVEGMASLQ